MALLKIPGVPVQLTQEQQQCLALLAKLRQRSDRVGYAPKAGSSEVPVCDELVHRGLFRKENACYAYTEVCVGLLNGETNPGMVLGIAPPVPRHVPSKAHIFLTPEQTVVYDASTILEEFRSCGQQDGYEYLPKTERQVVACVALADKRILEPVNAS